MRIEKYFNCTQDEIDARQFNFFVGISLGNKYFSKENIEKYILWALDKTKDDVAILIADEIHAINYEVFDGYSAERAASVALRKGTEIEVMINEIKNSLPKEKRHLIKIAKWRDYKESQFYKDSISVIVEEFENDTEFHQYILDIIKENFKKRVDGFGRDKLDRLAAYIIDELPFLLNGLGLEGKNYNLHPYPGSSLLDDLWMGLRQKTIFPELAEKLKIINKVAQIEAYVD
ncbi:MAG: tRNA-dependent cyclodipeptide synthase [Patescibacteria group bacterium]